MKLYINEKLFSIHNKYDVFDEKGEKKFLIESEIFTIGKKTHIYDTLNNEIVFAEQEIFHLTAQYKIYIRGNYSYKIKQLIKFFVMSFELDNGYSVEGNFTSHNFKVYDSKNTVVASISRKIFSIGDKYEIEINDENNIELLLSIIIVISNIIDSRQSDND